MGEVRQLLKEIDYTQVVAFALQEVFVEYFKGIDPNRLTRVPVVVHPLPVDERGAFQYLRDQERMKKPRLVTIEGIHICKMQRHPDKVEWYDQTMQRSDQFKELQARLEKFFENYIPTVERSCLNE